MAARMWRASPLFAAAPLVVAELTGLTEVTEKLSAAMAQSFHRMLPDGARALEDA
jgi:hypothetical protein